MKIDIQHQSITHLYGEGEVAMENTLIRQELIRYYQIFLFHPPLPSLSSDPSFRTSFGVDVTSVSVLGEKENIKSLSRD